MNCDWKSGMIRLIILDRISSTELATNVLHFCPYLLSFLVPHNVPRYSYRLIIKLCTTFPLIIVPSIRYSYSLQSTAEFVYFRDLLLRVN